MLLEDQHRPQPYSRSTTTTNIDTERLSLGQELVTFGVVKGNKSPPTFTSEVLEMLRILLGQSLHICEQVITNNSCVLHQIQSLDLVDYCAEKDRTSRVAHPCVKLSVWLVRSELRLPK